MHELISVKSGVRPDIVALVMQALPLVVFQELMETGESRIDNLVMLTEKSPLEKQWTSLSTGTAL